MADCILIADDEPAVRESLSEILRDASYTVETAADGSAAMEAIEEHDFLAVITDLRMPGADGLAVLRRVREVAPQTAVLVMTAHASLETAVEALREGATDYILKPVLFDDVLAKVARIRAYGDLVWQTQILRREIDRDFDPEEFVAKSAVMQDVLTRIRKVAASKATVLITGDSGTGKEVVARAIHNSSEARSRIFLPVNCAAIPESLLESQLFGHVRGSFTGAVGSHEGLFGRARGGTIFLDEIGELPIGLQAKLLRAIEAKEILPVGGTQPITVDIRVLAATNRNLRQMVEQGSFREDLFFRLSVVELPLPPLRARREDLPALVNLFVRRHNTELKRRVRGVDNAVMKLFLSHPWRGNVRELDNVLEHAMIFGESDWIGTGDLPPNMTEHGQPPLPDVGDDLRNALRAYERIHIGMVLDRAGGDKRVAAERLGLSLSSLYRKLEELEIAIG